MPAVKSSGSISTPAGGTLESGPIAASPSSATSDDVSKPRPNNKPIGYLDGGSKCQHLSELG